MPKTLDMFIGLATVMLFFSLAGTVLTNGFIGVIGLRGVCLNRGIRRLLRQVWPGLGEQDAATLADRLLLHPMIGVGQKVPFFQRQGTVIQREEVFLLLLEFATGGDDDKQTADPLSPELTAKLKAHLAASGIADPGVTLNQTRELVQQLEATRPDLAAYQRRTMAILATGTSRFTGKLFGWFDQTVERVSDNFTAHTRVLSLLSALIITFTFQLDSVWMLQRLSDDASFRQAMVADSSGVLATGSATANSTATLTPEQLRKADTAMSQYGLIRLPFSTNGNTADAWNQWWLRWHDIHMWGGCLLSVLLLTLGAPFWYSTLQNLVKLKSSLSSLDDQQRTERQTTDTTSTPAVSVTNVAPGGTANDFIGERGDLKALG